MDGSGRSQPKWPMVDHRSMHYYAQTCSTATVTTLVNGYQFFLNHRRYLRSEVPSRVGKSPAELLTGEPHAHWLELLGYTRFSQN